MLHVIVIVYNKILLVIIIVYNKILLVIVTVIVYYINRDWH